MDLQLPLRITRSLNDLVILRGSSETHHSVRTWYHSSPLSCSYTHGFCYFLSGPPKVGPQKLRNPEYEKCKIVNPDHGKREILGIGNVNPRNPGYRTSETIAPGHRKCKIGNCSLLVLHVRAPARARRPGCAAVPPGAPEGSAADNAPPTQRTQANC